MNHFKLSDPFFLPHCGCDIEFSVSIGKVLTIVGENGIGKTSLLKRFLGSCSSRISFIQQREIDAFYDRPLYKIKDALLSSRKDSINPPYFHSLWMLFGLEDKRNRMHSSLSGGESQALKICLGLALEAECYIFDEPSQYLDTQMKSILNEAIIELLSRDKRVLLVEHDLTWLTAQQEIMKLILKNNTLVVEEG